MSENKSEDLIRYDVLAQEALRGVVKKVLGEVAKAGLPGEHHFYISFDTRYPGVRLSTRMRAKYPDEMTIVVQHQYWELEATDQHFEIGLSFNDIPEKLLIPFAAIRGFFDPSVQFGLQFDVDPDSDEDGSAGSGEAANSADLPKLEREVRPALTSVEKQNQTQETGADKKAAADVQTDPASEDQGSADVVSLDAFRKKP